MPNVYKPGLIQIRAQYSIELDSDVPENVLWFQGDFTSPLTVANLTNIAAAFDPAWGNLWKQVGVSTAAYNGSVLTDWSSNIGRQISTNGVFPFVSGTQTGIMGAQVSALISPKILPRYRGGHGRIYLPWVGQSALQSTAFLTPSVVSALSTAYTSLFGAMAAVAPADGGPYTLATYRFRNDPAKAVVDVSTGEIIQTRLATQRRRLRKAPHH